MGFLYRSPRVARLVVDDVILVGVCGVGFPGARWRLVRVNKVLGKARGSDILLVILTLFRLWSVMTCSEGWRRGTWTRSNHSGRRGYRCIVRRRGSNVV